MLIKKINILISIILIIFFSLIIYFTIDSQLRRTIYSKFIGGYKLINYHIVGGYAYYRNFEAASNRILRYIEFSQKISSGKNVMLEGIIDSTELISSKAYTQEDFNIMQEVYIKINEITDDIYKNQIWLARSYSDDDIEKTKEYLNKALVLSKSSEEAYREIIRIFSNKHEVDDLVKNYCLNYFKEFAGSSLGKISTAQSENNFFEASNAKFAISKNGNYKNLYPKLISSLNTYQNYEFIFEKEEDIDHFEILKKFPPGIKTSIRNIRLINNVINELDINKLVVYSLSSYILNQTNDEIVFIAGSLRDDIFRFYLNENLKKIKSITFELKLERLPISNNSVCVNFNEN
tara:strand:- start:2681 stop:3724 length:1044 start_codon:yes stop_codon:yes gene_type:complete